MNEIEDVSVQSNPIDSSLIRDRKFLEDYYSVLPSCPARRRAQEDLPETGENPCRMILRFLWRLDEQA